MDIYSIIIIVGFALSLILGFALGLGRSLSIFITGIFGVIISIILCFAFGGLIAKIPFVADKIVELNAFFMSKSEFLGKIKLATIIYFVILFLIFQVVRFILAKIIKKALKPTKGESTASKAWNIINRLISMIFLGGMFVVLVFIALGVVSLFQDVQGVQDTLIKCQDYKFSLFLKMYENNPIDLRKIFGMVKEAAENSSGQVEAATQMIRNIF
ncbi:MAG: hypothetical protein K5765_03870 [Clostridia bacterium]|nr:hypothetical protein [Clostridia bacterium]